MRRAFLPAAIVSATLAILSPGPAWSRDQRLALRSLSPIAPGLAAVPRIAAPTGAAERRVNAGLDRLDAAVRSAWSECRQQAGRTSHWNRTVQVPLRGPHFLSVVITDEVYCGGAHPSSGTEAVVYDLRAGSPVDWMALLPPTLAGIPILGTAADGVRTVRLGSPRLNALFLARYVHQGPAKEAAECKETMADDIAQLPEPGFSAWLDTKRRALVLQRDLAQVAQVCADPVAIPAAVLLREGTAAELVTGLALGR